jgi:hypothetical protein
MLILITKNITLFLDCVSNEQEGTTIFRNVENLYRKTQRHNPEVQTFNCYELRYINKYVLSLQIASFSPPIQTRHFQKI